MSTKIKSTADIIGGDVFFATVEGFDPEYPQNGDLLPNGMYIRLVGSDGSVTYISAYELDKSLDIISEMSKDKANQSDVDALQQLLEGKASDTDIELLQAEVDGKVARVEFDSLSNTVAGKADANTLSEVSIAVDAKANQTDFDALSATVIGKADTSVVSALSEVVAGKADANTVTQLRADVEALQEALSAISNTGVSEAIQNQITYLNNEINKKLNSSELNPVKADISVVKTGLQDLDERIDAIDSTLTKKASTVYVQGQVSELNAAITGINTKLSGKAEKSDVVVKANKEEVDKLTKKVTDLNTTINTTLADVNVNYQELVNNLGNKADKASTEASISTLNTTIAQKADKLETLNTLNSLDARLTNVEASSGGDISDIRAEIEELECNVNNSIAEVNAAVSSTSKQISTQSSQIAKLQQADVKFEEQLRNEWVRVMTPEEYKRLAPIGDTFSDGTLNPYAKKSNVIYMLVRYNKPISVYIGDVLIAQAESKGSQGFAYNFPIIFQ